MEWRMMSQEEPTVFIVDDDEAVRKGLSRLMEAEDLRVEAFDSAQAFLDFHDQSQVGCLVLDVRMPGMSGLKLQDELVERDIDMPVILITGHGDMPMAVEAVKKGAFDFLEKPVGDQVLLEKIQEALAKDAELRRKRAEQEKENLAKFPSENPYPVLRVYCDGTVLYANPASTTLLRDNKSRIGRSAPQDWLPLVQDVLKSGRVQRMEIEHAGRVFAFRAVPVTDAGYVNFYGVDITEQKEADRKLLDHQAQLKSLASQLTLAEERERRRIAVALHDQICQSLAVSKIKLEESCDSLTVCDNSNALEDVCKLIDQAIADTRSLTFELSSPILHELGFEVAVASWLTEEMEHKHGIATEFENDEQPKPLEDDVRALLFRNVRELLTNVVKHAQANKVKVSIRKAASQLQVSIEDDGRGFGPAEVSAKPIATKAFGLFSIRERLEQLGGDFEIESEPGHGCRVTMMAPLKQGQVTGRG
jgi:signal transduction histidine kinase